MRLPPRTILLALLLATLSAPVQAQEKSTRLRRLESMPLEQRRRLAQNLARFDRLPAERRASLRDLDRQLAASPPADRDRYLNVMRRYYLWTRTLTDDQRQQLQDASPAARLALIDRFRAATRQAGPPASGSSPWVQVAAINPAFLEQTTFQVKVWFALDAAQKAELTKLRDPAQRDAKVAELARAHRIRREVRPNRQELQARLEQLKSRLESSPAWRNRPDVLTKPRLREDAFRRVREAAFLDDFQPAPVAPANLARFEMALPPWVREALDPLPPDAARRRLHLLYRLVFPAGEEVPGPKATTPPAPPPAAPAPSEPRKTEPAQGSVPF